MHYVMEIPTTSDIQLLQEFQAVFNTDIRPVAAQERMNMSMQFSKEFELSDKKLVPASIVCDIMLYLTKVIGTQATEDIMAARNSGDVSTLIRECAELDPYWKVTRALALCLKVFARDSDDHDYYQSDDADPVCYVCNTVLPTPLSLEDRKTCHGGCPQCAETLEAVFNK